jgi:hypothetical protein
MHLAVHFIHASIKGPCSLMLSEKAKNEPFPDSDSDYRNAGTDRQQQCRDAAAEDPFHAHKSFCRTSSQDERRMEQNEGERILTKIVFCHGAAGIPLHGAIFLWRILGSSWEAADGRREVHRCATLVVTWYIAGARAQKRARG